MALAADSMKVGQQWGRDLAQKITSQIEEEKVNAALAGTNAAPASAPAGKQ